MITKVSLLALFPFFLAASAAPAFQDLTERNASSNASSSLNPKCAPGGNFDLSKWALQLPTGSQGDPTTIPSSKLEGCSGYSEDGVFFTESGDGAMVMKVPGSPSSSGCVTTANSKHCRTELAESGSWDPNAATNRLTVSLSVATPDDSSHGTVIGQIHMLESVSVRPVCELYYNKQGLIVMGVEQTRGGGDEKISQVLATVPTNTQFTYEIAYESNVLSVTVNGQKTTLSTYSLDAPKSYFKVGNYNQGDSASDVHFFSIDVQH